MICANEHKLYRKLEAHFKVARAIPVARAALGLMIVLKCWRELGKTNRIALSANVCHEVLAAVLEAGYEPIFCDIDPNDASVIDKEWARAKDAGASVALVVHLYGNPIDLVKIRQYFSSPDCLIIDDVAQALGAVNSSGEVGGQGDVGLLSFGMSKQIDAGGAAILFKDPLFAEKVSQKLETVVILDDNLRLAIYSNFRQKLEIARTKLRTEGQSAAIYFNKLLEGYSPVLEIPFPTQSPNAVYSAFGNYRKSIDQRINKTKAWNAGLKNSGLVPIGMKEGSVPWRFACRLPGIDWKMQHRIGEEIRSNNIKLSHWYLPAHWMCGFSPGTLPGTERLAREVFQFWVDDQTTIESIENDAQIVEKIITSFIQKKCEVEMKLSNCTV